MINRYNFKYWIGSFLHKKESIIHINNLHIFFIKNNHKILIEDQDNLELGQTMFSLI